MSKIFVFSLGGSVFVSDGRIDLKFLKAFKSFICSRIKRNEKFIIVVGGGGLAREWQRAAKFLGVSRKNDLDAVGIKATWLNAELVRALFGKLANQSIVNDYNKTIVWKGKILIGAGWKPGCSTDYEAVLLAQRFDVREVFNLTGIDYLYEKDPAKFTKARTIKTISWGEYLKWFHYKWSPGMNIPFDPKASRLAKKLQMKLVILNGRNLKNLQAGLEGKSFQGSVVSPN